MTSRRPSLSVKRSCKCNHVIANNRQIKKRVLYDYCVVPFASGALYSPATSIGPVKAAATSLSSLLTPGVTRSYNANGSTQLRFDTKTSRNTSRFVFCFWRAAGCAEQHGLLQLISGVCVDLRRIVSPTMRRRQHAAEFACVARSKRRSKSKQVRAWHGMAHFCEVGATILQLHRFVGHGDVYRLKSDRGFQGSRWCSANIIGMRAEWTF